MGAYEDGPDGPIGILALVIIAYHAAKQAQEMDREEQEMLAEQEAKERERQQKEYDNRFDVKTKRQAAECKEMAREWLQVPLADRVGEEIDTLLETVGPDLRTANNLGPQGQEAIASHLRKLQGHLSWCTLVGRGLLPEDNAQYQASKAWLVNNFMPEGYVEQEQPTPQEQQRMVAASRSASAAANAQWSL